MPSRFKDEPTIAPSATSASSRQIGGRGARTDEDLGSGNGLAQAASLVEVGGDSGAAPETMRASAPPRSQVSSPACSIVRPGGGGMLDEDIGQDLDVGTPRWRRPRDLGRLPNDRTLVGVHETGENVDSDQRRAGCRGDCQRRDGVVAEDVDPDRHARRVDHCPRHPGQRSDRHGRHRSGVERRVAEVLDHERRKTRIRAAWWRRVTACVDDRIKIAIETR